VDGGFAAAARELVARDVDDRVEDGQDVDDRVEDGRDEDGRVEDGRRVAGRGVEERDAAGRVDAGRVPREEDCGDADEREPLRPDAGRAARAGGVRSPARPFRSERRSATVGAGLLPGRVSARLVGGVESGGDVALDGRVDRHLVG
jgi:hypothetical protein